MSRNWFCRIGLLSCCTIFGYVAFPIVIQIALPSQCLEANEVFFKIDNGTNMLSHFVASKNVIGKFGSFLEEWYPPFKDIFVKYFVATLQIKNVDSDGKFVVVRLKMQRKSGKLFVSNYLQLSRYDKLYASRQKLLMQLFFRHHFCETNFGY